MARSTTVGSHDPELDIVYLAGAWVDLKEALADWYSESDAYRLGLDFDWGRAVVQFLPMLRNSALTDDQRARIRKVLQEAEPFLEQMRELQLRTPAPDLMKAFLEPSRS